MQSHPRNNLHQPDPLPPPAVDTLIGIIIGIARSISGLQQAVEEILGRLRGAVKEYYTVDEVAEQTGRAPYTVRTWIREGRLCAVRVEGSGPRGRLLVPREELRKLIDHGQGESLSAIVTE